MTLATLNTANFAEMAHAMGISSDMNNASSKASTLPRLRIWNSAVMGQIEVKGKLKNVEVVPVGMYRLQQPDGSFVYAENVEIRVFVQRFMHLRYVPEERFYVKTVMAEDLNSDLRDNVGTFNCGKPVGFDTNFKDLPKDRKDFIQSCKRVRVLMGQVKLINALDAQGNEIETEVSPFIWEIKNTEAFKEMGVPFNTMGRQKRLPIHHWIKCGTVMRTNDAKTNNWYVPTQTIDWKDNVDLAEEDHQIFSDFMEWIGNYNEYIVNAHKEKGATKVSQDDATLVDEFINIDGE